MERLRRKPEASREGVGLRLTAGPRGAGGQAGRGAGPEVLGEFPADVLAAVAQHDIGWSISDLAALDSAAMDEPISFVGVPAQLGTEAWRRSIRAAEERSPLQAVLTSRHFCLLAPRDGESPHEVFLREESRWREPMETACGAVGADLDRYTAALGFCDLLSLLLCSGLAGTFVLPLAHPADPEARKAPKVLCKMEAGAVSFDRPVLRPASKLYAYAWARTAPGMITNQRCEWKVE